MKNLSKFAAVAGAATMVATVSLSPVLASSPGQLEGGSIIYKVKDVTQNGSYASSINANACDVLEYSIDLHNVAYGDLKNIVVSAPLSASGSSNMTATPSTGASAGTAGTVSVNLGSASGVSYKNGSTELFDASGHATTLADGITSGGINVGNLNGSTGEFVNFEATVNCPTTPTPPSTPVTTASVTPTQLPQTGSDELTGLAGMAGSGAIGYGAVMYRRSKKAVADKLRNRK